MGEWERDTVGQLKPKKVGMADGMVGCGDSEVWECDSSSYLINENGNVKLPLAFILGNF